MGRSKKRNKPKATSVPASSVPTEKFKDKCIGAVSAFRRWLKTGWGWLIKAPVILLSVLEVTAMIAEHTNLLPQIQITSAFKDKNNDPYSAQYNLPNVGFIPLWDVELGCFVDNAHFTEGLIIERVLFKQAKKVEELSQNQILTTKCRLAFRTDNLTPGSGKLKFVVWYTWLFWRFPKVWALEYVPSAGEWRFQPSKSIDFAGWSFFLISDDS